MPRMWSGMCGRHARGCFHGQLWLNKLDGRDINKPDGDRAPLSRVYAITRAKKALNAWYWRVSFWRRGQHYFQAFYDLKHGGSKKALAAAIVWRDRQLAGAKILTYREFRAHRRSNNTSGVAGVHFLKSPRQPRGAWQAKIKLADGRKITKSFSVRRFGTREAFKRAVAARTDMLELVGERLYLKHPIAKKFAAKRMPL